MTIVTDPARAAELAASGQSNNPAILWDSIATAFNVSSEHGSETGGPATNAVTGTTYDAALPTTSGGQAALEVTGTALTANGACIYAHNLGTIGASVRVEYSTDGGASWLDAGAGIVNPADDQAIFWRFDERSADDWRINITGAGAEQPAIGGICIGLELVVEQRIYQGYRPPITPTEVTMIDNVSEGAHLMGTRSVDRGSLISVDVEHIKDTTIRGDAWVAFQKHFNGGGALLWAWRPTKYGDAFWAWRNGDPIAPVNSGPQALMSASFNLRAYHE